MTPARWFWSFLLFGIAVRCVALTLPLVDAHPLRQCQTAAMTQSIIEEPGWPLSARIPWAGDFDERFLLELPIYNYLVAAVYWITGQLTLSGKLVSVILWAISFWLLQGLWRRLLDPAAAIWANLLFVISPLNVFYAQAFMPEMLVQSLGFAFVLLLLRYDECPSLWRWSFAATIGLVALLTKATATAHLYLLFLFLVIARTGWKSLFHPRYIIAGVLSVAAVLVWGNYLDAVNQSPLSCGGVEQSVRGFVGPLAIRFQIRPWLMIALYAPACWCLVPFYSRSRAERWKWRAGGRRGCSLHSSAPSRSSTFCGSAMAHPDRAITTSPRSPLSARTSAWGCGSFLPIPGSQITAL